MSVARTQAVALISWPVMRNFQPLESIPGQELNKTSKKGNMRRIGGTVVDRYHNKDKNYRSLSYAGGAEGLKLTHVINFKFPTKCLGSRQAIFFHSSEPKTGWKVLALGWENELGNCVCL